MEDEKRKLEVMCIGCTNLTKINDGLNYCIHKDAILDYVKIKSCSYAKKRKKG